MKKLALTNLMLLMAIKSVGACTPLLVIDPDYQVQPNYDNLFFYVSISLILPIIGLYFLRKRQGLWTVITAIISLLIYFPALFFVTAIYFVPCGANYPVSYVIKGELFLMLLLFTFQLASWIGQKMKQKKLQ